MRGEKSSKKKVINSTAVKKWIKMRKFYTWEIWSEILIKKYAKKAQNFVFLCLLIFRSSFFVLFYLLNFLSFFSLASSVCRKYANFSSVKFWKKEKKCSVGKMNGESFFLKFVKVSTAVKLLLAELFIMSQEKFFNDKIILILNQDVYWDFCAFWINFECSLDVNSSN